MRLPRTSFYYIFSSRSDFTVSKVFTFKIMHNMLVNTTTTATTNRNKWLVRTYLHTTQAIYIIFRYGQANSLSLAEFIKIYLDLIPLLAWGCCIYGHFHMDTVATEQEYIRSIHLYYVVRCVTGVYL